MPGKRLVEALFVAALVTLAAMSPTMADEKPITIGFGMALTGGLAPNGRAALLAMQIWEDKINAQGGLLGRPASTRSCSTSTKSIWWSAATAPT
jgi:branched-chain amino acid transport system substrate-binding protein